MKLLTRHHVHVELSSDDLHQPATVVSWHKIDLLPSGRSVGLESGLQHHDLLFPGLGFVPLKMKQG